MHKTPPFSSSSDVVPAGFLRRWAALFVDQLILSTVFYALIFVAILVLGIAGALPGFVDIDSDQPPAWLFLFYLATTGLYYCIAGLYFSFMESSSYQATLGKMALGIKVVSQTGERLGFLHALGRWFAASLSYLTLYIGFFMAAFTQKKQALHDMLTSTQIVDKWAYTEYPERQSRQLGGCALAFGIGMLALIIIAVLGILVAIAIPAYQQYTVRAQSRTVTSAVESLTHQVEQFYHSTQACPENGDVGFQPPTDYASEAISRIVIGEFETGYCGISAWLPPASGTVERQFLAEWDPEEDAWYCTSKGNDFSLPSWCQ